MVRHSFLVDQHTCHSGNKPEWVLIHRQASILCAMYSEYGIADPILRCETQRLQQSVNLA